MKKLQLCILASLLISVQGYGQTRNFTCQAQPILSDEALLNCVEVLGKKSEVGFVYRLTSAFDLKKSTYNLVCTHAVEVDAWILKNHTGKMSATESEIGRFGMKETDNVEVKGVNCTFTDLEPTDDFRIETFRVLYSIHREPSHSKKCGCEQVSASGKSRLDRCVVEGQVIHIQGASHVWEKLGGFIREQMISILKTEDPTKRSALVDEKILRHPQVGPLALSISLNLQSLETLVSLPKHAPKKFFVELSPAQLKSSVLSKTYLFGYDAYRLKLLQLGVGADQFDPLMLLEFDAVLFAAWKGLIPTSDVLSVDTDEALKTSVVEASAAFAKKWDAIFKWSQGAGVRTGWSPAQIEAIERGDTGHVYTREDALRSLAWENALRSVFVGMNEIDRDFLEGFLETRQHFDRLNSERDRVMAHALMAVPEDAYLLVGGGHLPAIEFHLMNQCQK